MTILSFGLFLIVSLLFSPPPLPYAVHQPLLCRCLTHRAYVFAKEEPFWLKIKKCCEYYSLLLKQKNASYFYSWLAPMHNLNVMLRSMSAKWIRIERTQGNLPSCRGIIKFSCEVNPLDYYEERKRISWPENVSQSLRKIIVSWRGETIFVWIIRVVAPLFDNLLSS